MVRLSILTTLLISISGIALTFEPFEKLSYSLYNAYSVLGINPSFTPITQDMSFMTIPGKGSIFAIPFQIIVENNNLKQSVINPAQLNLYRHKLPIILFLEQAQEGGDLVEARYSICHQMTKLVGFQVIKFYLQVTETRENLFSRKFSCEFS